MQRDSVMNLAPSAQPLAPSSEPAPSPESRAPLSMSPPFGVAPMAGMTDSAFRRLVKRQGACGLVVSEMVSSEALVRGIGRSLEYLEFTDEERPVSIQIFGGDPSRMAAAAQVVESRGADIVDVNMGCPVPKIAKHNAGCSLMREPEHAASIVAAMVKAVKIPVTVKMRAGWNERAGERARAGAHGRSGGRVGRGRARPHRRAGVSRAGGLGPHRARGEGREDPRVRLRRPRRARADSRPPADARPSPACSSDAASCATRGCSRRPRISWPAGRRAHVTPEDRKRFLLEYIDLLVREAPAAYKRVRRTIAGS